MPDYKSKIEYDGKMLPDVFKELKEKQKQDYNKHLISVNNIFVVSLFICFGITLFLSNSIHATQVRINEYNKNEKIIVEENNNSIDVLSILNNNITVIKRKEIVTEQSDVNYMTIYRDNPSLPKDEQIVVQEGILGKQELTIVRTYENDEIVEENIIETNIYEDAIQEIIDVGSSEFLKDLNIHLGDVIYVSENTSLKETNVRDSNVLIDIPQFYDVRILETYTDWSKVEFNDQIGFIENSVLVSETIDNEIVDKNRIKKVTDKVDVNMELNQVSGLSLEDYQKMLSNISSDKNKIFENNAEVFFEIEQKYNINGVFLAALAIHESGWGTSKISQDKNNLFGYGAYDDTPYECSYGYETHRDGIDTVARALVKNYLNPAGTIIYDGQVATGLYYNGATVGGINVRYASDTNWHIKVFSKMLYLYDRL